jgi:(R)-amidase
MPITIAVVQQDGNPGRVEANRAKAVSFARYSVNQGADVVLFHEELVVGYTDDMRELAEPVDGPTTQGFRKVLEGSDSLIVYGATERDGDDCYISAPVVSAAGVIANYRKMHLWRQAEGLRHEPTFYRPGDSLVTFDVKGRKCGVMICYDGDFPETTRSYADLGCTVLFWLNNRRSRGHEEVRDLAKDNSVIMAVSCCSGLNESGDRCRGGSNITDSSGTLLAEIWDREGVIVRDVEA